MSIFGNFGDLLKPKKQTEPPRRSKRTGEGPIDATSKAARREPLDDISNKKRAGLIRVDKNTKISTGTTSGPGNSFPFAAKDHSAPSKPVQVQLASYPVANGWTASSLAYGNADGRSSSTAIDLDSNSGRDTMEDFMDVEDSQMAPECLPEGVPDIDLTDDPLCNVICVKEIYQFLRTQEKKYKPFDYLPTQHDINSHMRSILVDWLVEVAEEYKLANETLYLTLNYLDRYLSIKSVPRGQLQLLGVVCMLIASKFEEVYAPAVDEFVYISDNTYTKEEIFGLEGTVLNALSFQLAAPSIKAFLRRFVRASGGDPPVRMLANYLCELSLLDYEFINYLPSVIAAAAVCLSLHTMGNAPWSASLAHYTCMTLNSPEMRACVEQLHDAHVRASSPTNQLRAIPEKYAHSKFLKVSQLAPAPHTPII